LKISLYLFVFLLSRPLASRSRERKKRLNSLLSCVLLLLLLGEEDLVLFRARARKRRVLVLLCGIVIVRDLGSISEEFCARAKREIFSHKREKKTTAEGRGEKVFLLSFLSFSFCFLQNQSKKTGVEEDPSCGSESVAVKKGGPKGKEERIFFFVLTFILSLFSRTYKNRE
jgi:hypothetical protein